MVGFAEPEAEQLGLAETAEVQETPGPVTVQEAPSPETLVALHDTATAVPSFTRAGVAVMFKVAVPAVHQVAFTDTFGQ